MIKRGFKKVTKEYPFINENIKLFYSSVKSFFPKNKEYIFEFIKNGEAFINLTEEDILDELFEFPNDNSYDFYIFSDYKNSKNNCISKIIGKNICNSYYNSQLSSVKFIMSEITFGQTEETKKTTKISFSTEKYNYLIVNNIIDEEFIRYFMKKHYNEDLFNQNVLPYTLKLIDGDINLKKFTNENKFVILENSYRTIENQTNTTDELVNERLDEIVKTDNSKEINEN